MINRDYKISILIPTKNEEVTIRSFIQWCEEGMRNANVKGEIIFLDSSSDNTPKIAQSLGARVIAVESLGLGYAYSKAQNLFNGEFVFLGDADCTYDFRNLNPFLAKFEEGYNFVIGNRFMGSIEKGAMPFHHQYFGSPATSLIFRKALGIPTGDIHCGMRAMTADVFNSLPFLENGWEYATEMIVSARNQNAKIVEIPIDFYKEPKGRVSHHRRSSWLSPFRAGWGTLRVTATYFIDRLLVVPGLIGLAASTLLNLATFTFPQFFFERFRIGILSQSFLTFISSLSGFMFVCGMLARIAYRRQSNFLQVMFSNKFASKMFSVSAIFISLEIYFTIFSISQWIFGTRNRTVEFMYDLRYLSWWLAFSSLFFAVLSFSVLSLIGTHAQKLKKN